MNLRTLACLSVLLAAAISGAAPSPKAATDPSAPELTELQQNLLMQLSDAEANIQAANKALVRIGYNVGVAYGRIDSNLKGNEYMNRKGGGPVRWDEFYGKTARDFVMHDAGSPVYHQVQRPTQFNFIYKANNDQIERAKEQIANLAKDQTALLDRRRKHEADQSRLWATLAWEQVKDREIALHPLCRYGLQPSGPDAAVLRPLILFLRTADRTAIDGLDAIAEDQKGAFQSADTRMAAAFGTLQLSLSDAMEDSKLNPAHKEQAQGLKLLCKQLSEECEVIASNYANAQDRDQANQDTSKLEFRAQLQASLTKFATLVAQLDDDTTGAAKAWGVTPDRATPTSDAVPAAANPPVASGGGDAVTKPTPGGAVGMAPADNKTRQGKHIDLLKLVDLKQDSVEGNWSFQDEKLTCQSAARGLTRARVEFPYTPPKEYDYQVTYIRDRGVHALGFVCCASDHSFMWVTSSHMNKTAGFGNVDGKGNVDGAYPTSNVTTKQADQWVANGQIYTELIKVRADGVAAYSNGKLVSEFKTDFKNLAVEPQLHDKLALGLSFMSSQVTVTSAEVIEITGEGKALRK